MFFTIKKELVYMYSTYPKMRTPFRVYIALLLICSVVGIGALGYGMFIHEPRMHPFMFGFSWIGLVAAALCVIYSTYTLAVFHNRHKVVD